MDLEATVSAFGKLGLLSAKIEALRDDVEGALLTPLLSTRSATDRQAHVYVNEGLISLHDGMKTGTEGLFDDIKLIMKTLNMLLPSKVARPLSQKLMSSIVSKLTSSWLLRSLPVDIPGMEQFQSEVFLVSKFANAIESSGWSGGAELLAWIDDIPRAWLAKRRESSLDDVRRLLLSQRQGTKEVERIEKQKVSRRDDVFVQNSGGDDWDAGWSNEDEDDKPQKQSSSAETDDEDVSAWGLDEGGDQTEVDAPNHNKASSEDDDGGDAWGWDDEGDGAETESPTTHKTAQSTPKRENKRAVATVEPSEREYVLRETYHITDIPETLLELILTQLRDASVLSQEGQVPSSN
jgi:protein transport protein DSL1/ZW10